MENMYLTKYYKKNPSTSWLRINHFKHSSVFSVRGCEAWVLQFPVYKSGDSVTLIGEIVVYDDGEVRVHVLDGGYVRSYWAPFYCPDDWKNHHPLLEIVSKKMSSKLKSLGVKKKHGTRCNTELDR